MRDRIIQALFEAVDELNSTRAADEQIVKSKETVLFGKEGGLDSLGAVNFLLTAEQKLCELFGRQLNVAEQAMLAGEGDHGDPPLTLEEFAGLVEKLADGD